MTGCMVKPDSIRSAITELERAHEGKPTPPAVTIALQALYTAYAEAQLQTAGVYVDLVDVVRTMSADNWALALETPTLTAPRAEPRRAATGTRRSRTEPPPKPGPTSSAM